MKHRSEFYRDSVVNFINYVDLFNYVYIIVVVAVHNQHLNFYLQISYPSQINFYEPAIRENTYLRQRPRVQNEAASQAYLQQHRVRSPYRFSSKGSIGEYGKIGHQVKDSEGSVRLRSARPDYLYYGIEWSGKDIPPQHTFRQSEQQWRQEHQGRYHGQ
ncbi:hypothetical protein FGO68_gene2786 [Halteria grandinella]|uniref:Uncharacterized protein n=1 Tax=Halteria grandinella TaxID=5974 RepID=A0A8J8NC82_HALGN|nr:hypothetical protein FGO68_gene2786 [Halteria grandinella]